MTISLKAVADGLSGTIQVSGVDSLTLRNNGTALELEHPVSTTCMIVDADGKVAFPQNNTPAFQVKDTNGQTITTGSYQTVLCDTELFDLTSAYNTATGFFQPTTPGYYQLSVSNIGVQAHATGGVAVSIVVTSATQQSVASSAKNDATLSPTLSCGGTFVFNGTTDYAHVLIYQNSGVSLGLTDCVFSGSLVRPA